MRKKSVHLAYLRSGFKTQAYCVPALVYDMSKEDVSYSMFVFLFKNIPMLVIQCLFIMRGHCGYD
jgi:hypothetical protein